MSYILLIRCNRKCLLDDTGIRINLKANRIGAECRSLDTHIYLSGIILRDFSLIMIQEHMKVSGVSIHWEANCSFNGNSSPSSVVIENAFLSEFVDFFKWTHFFLSSKNRRFLALMGRDSLAALMAARRAFSALRIFASA